MTDNSISPRAGGRSTELSETTQESLDRLRLELDELRASRARLVAADDAARRAIERELHDGTQQHLIALAVNLQLARELLDADPAAARQLLDEMGQDVQLAVEETAKLAHRIYPPLLEAGGLAAALRAAAVATGVKTRIEVGATHLPAKIAGAVYFSCLDVLDLAGRGGTATIDVQVENEALSLEAFAATTRTDETVGVARDRVEGVGGVFTTHSAPGRGIRVLASLPLSQ